MKLIFVGKPLKVNSFMKNIKLMHQTKSNAQIMCSHFSGPMFLGDLLSH
jgi:hypothetical protein